MTDASQWWDREAETFDEAADHGLRDPEVRRAWSELLLPLIGSPGSRVADVGCGTGSLSVLLAEAGHQVAGVDFSAEMIRLAREKARHLDVTADFVVADASAPPWPPGTFDVVLSRHVLWAMVDPAATLAAWSGLLADGGRLILVEGDWSTGAGLTPQRCMGLVEEARGRRPTLQMLSEPIYWGGPISDDRYLVTS